jgi:hypothetical protein
MNYTSITSHVLQIGQGAGIFFTNLICIVADWIRSVIKWRFACMTEAYNPYLIF